MQIEDFSFGRITIDGVAYEHDVIIDHGKVRKRSKKPSKLVSEGENLKVQRRTRANERTNVATGALIRRWAAHQRLFDGQNLNESALTRFLVGTGQDDVCHVRFSPPRRLCNAHKCPGVDFRSTKHQTRSFDQE
jgi:hypothetical protein